MTEKASIINLENLATKHTEFPEIRLDSGRSVVAKSAREEDILEIREADGRMTVKIRLTDDGPVFSVEGARLQLKSPDSIALRARHVEIMGEEETIVRSDGSLRISSSEEMNVDSEGDLRFHGKMIHIN